MATIKFNRKLRLSSLVLLFVMLLSPLTLNFVTSSPMRNSRLNYEKIPSNFNANKDLDNEVNSFLATDDASSNLRYDHSQPWLKMRPKQYVFNKRRRRELTRTLRKIDSSSSQLQMPSTYPFIMAEMIPGAVKTRHPSIIAVNGCPAYYIADHKGRCRQVFQYTVNFGQRSSPNPNPSHNIFGSNKFAANPFFARPQTKPNPQSFIGGGVSDFRKFFKTTPPPVTTTTTSTPSTTTEEIQNSDKYGHEKPSSSPRLVSLFRNAAKRFDLSFLNKKSSSSNSGETNEEKEINKLREKILKALKIKQSKDTNKNAAKDSVASSSNTEVNVKTTTADYDD